MTMHLFLNDLSAPTGVVARTQSIAFLKGLVETVRAARAIDTQVVLNCVSPLNEFSLGGGATIASIRNDGNCIEESRFLKVLNSRAPLGRILAEAEISAPPMYEYKLPSTAPVSPGVTTVALGLAHALNGLGVSLPSSDLWRRTFVSLELFELDGDAEITTRTVLARNAADSAGVATHDAALRDSPRPKDGKQLWAHRETAFPHLEFIPRTRSQIEDIRAGDPMLDQLLIKLSGINQAIATWVIAQTPYPMFPFNVRPESTSRIALTKFRDLNGIERIFSDHTDLAPTEARIHFIIETAPRQHALIGHVGRKLGIG